MKNYSLRVTGFFIVHVVWVKETGKKQRTDKILGSVSKRKREKLTVKP